MKKLPIGDWIRKRRKELRLTAEGLANKVGVSRVYISNIERKRRLPSKKLFIKIDGALNLGPVAVGTYISEKDKNDVFDNYLQSKHITLYRKGPAKTLKVLVHLYFKI